MKNVYIVGSGKLANELLQELSFKQKYVISPWANRNNQSESAIVIHAGSGRELQDVISYCKQSNSILIELSTDGHVKLEGLDIPIILCPNTNILMLKFMNMLAKNGPSFSQYQINIIESHQANKTSIPGTAVAIANSLAVAENRIESVRAIQKQQHELNIPEQNLARHAYHRIEISDSKACSIILETKVLGDSPYVDGVREIVLAAVEHNLEKRLYNVMELIDNKWI